MAVPVCGHLLVGQRLSLASDFLFCLKPRCPHCRQGRLFRPWTISVVEQCAVCAKPLAAHDIGDGAAVFLIFLLGFTLIPLAWMVELWLAPPLWLHGVVWTLTGLGIIALLLPATKAYIMLLEQRHRGG